MAATKNQCEHIGEIEAHRFWNFEPDQPQPEGLTHVDHVRGSHNPRAHRANPNRIDQLRSVAIDEDPPDQVGANLALMVPLGCVTRVIRWIFELGIWTARLRIRSVGSRRRVRVEEHLLLAVRQVTEFRRRKPHQRARRQSGGCGGQGPRTNK